MAEHLHHSLLDALVGDGLLRLVLIGGLVGKGGNDNHQAVLHILKGDLALILVVLVVLLQIGVDLVDKGVAHRLVRGASVLQPGGVVVVLRAVHPVGEGCRHVDLHVVQGHVRPVAHLFLALPELHGGEGVLSAELFGVVQNAVLIVKVRGLKFARGHLVFQVEGDARVDHRLALQNVLVILQAHVDIGEHLQVRLPLDEGARALFGVGLLVQAAHVFPVLKVQGVAAAVPADIHVHILGGVLGGAQAQAV